MIANQLSDAELVKELGCLRNTLSPALNRSSFDLLAEAEKRLNRGVSTTPGPTVSKGPQQGRRGKTKKELFLKYYNR
jgi:hypothetical protein